MRRSQAVAELFSTGRIVDCILALMALEILAVILIRNKTRQGVPAVELIVSVAAGAALLLALRAALIGSTWRQIAPWLIIALGAHLVDLRARWRTQRVH